VKYATSAAILLLLLSLLAWLSSLSLDTTRFDRELKALDDFTRFERGMNREVLTARTGLSRNYDALVRMTEAYDRALERLREVAEEGPNERAAFEALAGRARGQQDLVEKFKSRNALLQNSFAYFGMFNAALAESKNAPVAGAANQLSAAMLHLTLDTSSSSAREVQEAMSQLAALRDPSSEVQTIQAVLAHGGMLHDVLPATDAILKALIEEASTREQDKLRSLIEERRRTAKASAGRYNFLLYVASLGLLGVLIYLGLQLRTRAIALRRRAEFDQVIAGISTRFINLAQYEIAPRIEQALEKLAGLVGADRAYFVMPGAPQQSYRWCRDGVTFPRGWPERAPEVVSRLNLGHLDVIHCPSIQPSHSYDTTKLLTEVGLRGWLCIAGRDQKEARAILGFDALRARALTQHGEDRIFRMAFEVIDNAVRRVALEQEKERLQAKLQQARRMETIGALASGVAHNFNNIIGAIIGYTEMADAQARSGRADGSHFNQIRHASERARQLVDQILTFGRKQSGHGRVSIKSLVAETEQLLRASLPPDFELVVGQSAEDVDIVSEAARLQQVFLNICRNAVQATNKRGRIEIRIELRESDRPMRIRGTEISAGRFAIVSISDNGHGMDEATVDRVFEPFFTTRQEGNGLGLSTARQTVLECGGAIEVKSAPGAGARFDIWLPSAPATGSTAVRHASPEVARGRGEMVLIMQPDATRLLLDEEILAALGYEPVGFNEPSEALRMCSTDPGRFHAMLICPHNGTNGALEFAARVHEVAPGLPILLAIPSARYLDPAQLAASGVSELLHYPLVSSPLSSALSRGAAVRPPAVLPRRLPAGSSPPDGPSTRPH
jgi:signal transduction histidine kinase